MFIRAKDDSVFSLVPRLPARHFRKGSITLEGMARGIGQQPVKG
jgi:hypothetical protein